jgi:hypothetical protein
MSGAEWFALLGGGSCTSSMRIIEMSLSGDHHIR